MEDNEVIIKRAFEKYIIDQFSRFLMLGKQTGQEMIVDKEISHRLFRMAVAKVLPDIKADKSDIAEADLIIIKRGFLDELYRCGHVTNVKT